MEKILNSSVSENQGSRAKREVLNSSLSENQEPQAKRKVLIVEDDRFLRELISQKLQKEGFQVSQTSLDPTGFRTNARIDKILQIF